MTDRHAAYLVTLVADIRDDDAEAIITALRMVRGVAGVEPLISDWQMQAAQSRADNDWRQRLTALLRETR